MATEYGWQRAAFRAMVPLWAELGYTFNAMTLKARDLGLSFRRITMLSDIRSVMGLIRGEVAAKGVDPDERYPKTKMVETDLARAYRYRVYGWAEYLNMDTGETDRRRISMYTDEWLSLKDQAAIWEREQKDEYGEKREIIDSVKFTVVEHNRGLKY